MDINKYFDQYSDDDINKMVGGFAMSGIPEDHILKKLSMDIFGEVDTLTILGGELSKRLRLANDMIVVLEKS